LTLVSGTLIGRFVGMPITRLDTSPVAVARCSAGLPARHHDRARRADRGEGQQRPSHRADLHVARRVRMIERLNAVHGNNIR
jgi:hypothetical protein